MFTSFNHSDMDTGVLPVLALCRPFHLVNSVVVDYLHCLLLGVTKMFIEFWFDKAHKGKLYHIGNKVRKREYYYCYSNGLYIPIL